jgi:hypothetical protein
VHGHQPDAGVLRAGRLVGLRQQRQAIDEAAQRGVRLAQLMLAARRRPELGEVLEAIAGFLRLLLAQVLEVAGLLHHLLDDLRDGVAFDELLRAGDDVDERLERGVGARRHALVVEHVASLGPERTARGLLVEQAGGHERRRVCASGRRIGGVEARPSRPLPCRASAAR